MKTSLALLVVALAPAPVAASAATITVTPTVAPNVFGSPSWNAWVANATGALHDGDSARGNPSLPTYYHAQSNVSVGEAVVTGFPSWHGQVDPGTVFGSAFSNELGNRLHFGLVIDGDGSQFSISQLSFNAVSDDALNILGFGFAGGYGYSDSYVGLLKGADGVLFTSDDVLVTGGPDTTLVDGLVGRGSGNAVDAYCPGCSLADQQAQINAAEGYFSHTTHFTGTYSLGDSSGSGTFTISVPEPSTWALMLAGFGLVGIAARRRLRTA